MPVFHVIKVFILNCARLTEQLYELHIGSVGPLCFDKRFQVRYRLSRSHWSVTGQTKPDSALRMTTSVESNVPYSFYGL